MKLAKYEVEGLFTNPDYVKDLPGVAVVLSVRVLYVGQSGFTYRSGVPRGVSKPLFLRERLKHNEKKACWEEHRGEGELAYAVIYEPDDKKALKRKEQLQRIFNPPCSESPPA